jgi:iron complex transport system ATP-binding protein
VLLKDGRVVAEGDAHQVFNADLLSSVYDIRVVVYNDPVSGAPTVLPVS